jgi:hypothetical protein
MARPGQTIVNTRTGQEMTFLKTGGETEGSLLQIDCLSPPTLLASQSMSTHGRRPASRCGRAFSAFALREMNER